MANPIQNSNDINAAYDATDVTIRNLGTSYASGARSKPMLLATVADAFISGALRHAPVDADKKVTHVHYAQYADKIWLETAKDGANRKPRVAEIGAVLRATQAFPAIVPFAEKIAVAMKDEITLSTYNAIVAICRVQCDQKNIKAPLSEAKARAAITPKKSVKDEIALCENVAKALAKLSKEYLSNATHYERAILALKPIVDAAALKAARDADIAGLVKRGYTVAQATAIIDTPAQTAPDGGKVLANLKAPPAPAMAFAPAPTLAHLEAKAAAKATRKAPAKRAGK